MGRRPGMLPTAAAASWLVLAAAGPGAAPAGAEPLHDVRLTAPPASVPAAVREARRRWARTAVVRVDRVDGGLRWLARTDGFLSGRSGAPPRVVAMRWARRNLDVLGLRRRDLRGLQLVHRRRSPGGVVRLIFEQRHRGVPAFDDSLRVNVAADGRVVNVGGSPRSGLRVESIRPRLGAAGALRAGAAAVGATIGSAGGHRAGLVIVSTGPRTARLAWRLWLEASPHEVYTLLVDATDGRLLRRANNVKSAAAGLAWRYYPGAPRGGVARRVDFGPWLAAADRLRGTRVHVYNDFDGTEDFHSDPVDPTQADGDLVLAYEEIRPSGDGNWIHPYRPVQSPAGRCPDAGCAWNHLVPGSWLGNRDQDGTQVFYFANRFLDHLAAAPIRFDDATSGFEFDGSGGDGIYASSMDAAGQAAGRPVPLVYSNNANMLTPPDGRSPRMQLFLFEPLVVPDFPFSDVSSGSDASIVYHELAHGLSNRLVVDAAGEGALHSAQAGAMGEGWSDFYAMDLLLADGLLDDTAAPGELKVGRFADGGQDLVRTEAIDCTLGAPGSACPRRRSTLGGGGGYTYEHFGRIAGGPEVHADGEIWGQTLMDLRRRLVADRGAERGGARARSLVTRGMELAPPEPSFLDMRDAILQADMLAGGRDRRRIWEVFAARGMGASARTVDGADVAPEAAFDLPSDLPPADAASPSVTIDVPREGAAVRTESARFAGTATDDTGVVSVTVDGHPAQLEGDAWTARLELPAGRRTVQVVARDADERSGTAARTVIGDARAPRLLRVTARRRGRRVVVRGVTRDDVRVRHVWVARKRVDPGRTGRFAVSLRGRRRARVTVRAVDAARRSTTRRLRVR